MTEYTRVRFPLHGHMDTFLQACMNVYMPTYAQLLTELHKDVLGGIKDHVLEVLADQDVDGGFVPVLRDVLAHEVGLGEKRGIQSVYILEKKSDQTDFNNYFHHFALAAVVVWQHGQLLV